MAAEIRKNFHQKLEEVRRDITLLGAMTIEAIPRATEALLSGDLTAADEIINDDDLFDLKALQIEEECLNLLVLQAPMAKDLRQVVTALKMTSEIERSADLVANICKGARRIYGTMLDPKIRGIVDRMSTEAQRLFRTAMEAYADQDGPKGAALGDMDDLLDKTHAEFIQTLLESQSTHQLPIQSIVQLAVIGRFYERIGDHAVNIGERVEYMVSGWLPEHLGAARAAARQQVEPDQTQGNGAPGNGTSGEATGADAGQETEGDVM